MLIFIDNWHSKLKITKFFRLFPLNFAKFERKIYLNFSEISRNLPKLSEIYRNCPKFREIYRNFAKRCLPKLTEILPKFREISRNFPKLTEISRNEFCVSVETLNYQLNQRWKWSSQNLIKVGWMRDIQWAHVNVTP